ncbi:MAG TPA: 2-dehydropantoate 2-reductase N-terminal domain-containing protein [Terriglobia bacterium]|nr:2-dehydropantoate 2-reductase N-terminal domain-containing protein [Terriglobia bacterium]
MKILIVGTGVIGVIYGWALHQAGVDVTHFVRPGKAVQFPGGLRLDLLDERKGYPPKAVHPYPIRCVDSISSSDGYELIIVPTNGYQVESAIQDLAPVSGDATFLIFSGNWNGLASYDAFLSRERYLLGYPDGGGTIREAVYWTNLGPDVHLGLLEGQSSERLEQIKALFACADIHAEIQENILHWLWVHNAGVIGFAAGFAKHREVTAYLRDKSLLRQCILSTKELYQLCGLRGVDLKKFPDTILAKFPVWLVAMLLRWNFKRNESMQRYTAHAASAGSLRETEIFYNSMVKTADELGFAVPYLRSLETYMRNS